MNQLWQGPNVDRAQIDQIIDAENRLSAARDRAIVKLEEQARAQLHAMNQDLTMRFISANAYGDPAATRDVELTSFDWSADRQRVTFAENLVNTFGEAYKETEEYAAEIAFLEKTLGAERVALLKKHSMDAEALAKQESADLLAIAKQEAADLLAIAKAKRSTNYVAEDLTTRFLTAANDNSPQGLQYAALYNYDTKAAREKTAMLEDYAAVWGEMAHTSQEYADLIVLIDKTQAAERLSIVRNFNKQFEQTAAGVLNGLTNYARGLQTSALSPLNDQNQYQLAATQFNTTSAGALSGDARSLRNLQATADSFLNTSRIANGSGIAYAADFDRVLKVLEQVSDMPADALTGIFFREVQEEQTQLLVNEIRDLKTEVVNLRLQQKISSSAPDRVAA